MWNPVRLRSLFYSVLVALLIWSPAWADSLGSASGGQAANQSSLDGAIYNSSPPSLSSGQQVGFQADSAGNVKFNCAVGCSAAAAADPCVSSAKSFADFESTSSGGSIITAASAKKAYICSVSIVASAAANVSLVEGTGSSVCTGGTTAGVFLNTGTTAANGAAFGANGGIQAGSGNGTIAGNATANQNICVVFTTTNSPQINAHVAYVQQ